MPLRNFPPYIQGINRLIRWLLFANSLLTLARYSPWAHNHCHHHKLPHRCDTLSLWELHSQRKACIITCRRSLEIAEFIPFSSIIIKLLNYYRCASNVMLSALLICRESAIDVDR